MKSRELAAAGVRDSRLVQAYGECGRFLARKNPAAYPLMRLILPADKRPFYDAIFAFCGYVDKILDDPGKSVDERGEAYDRFVAEFFTERAAAASPDQGALISEAFRHFTGAWDIAPASVREFLRAMRGDLTVTDFDTYADLHRYMRGVSGAPARWVNALLDPRNEEAAEMATSLGYGIYLLDFLSDLREDLELGRVYVPLEDLDRFGMDRTALERTVRQGAMTEQLRELVQFQAHRVSCYFAEAEEWWRHVHPSCRQLPRQYLTLARQSLQQLLRADCNVFRPPTPRTRALGAARVAGTTGLAYLRARRNQRAHR